MKFANKVKLTRLAQREQAKVLKEILFNRRYVYHVPVETKKTKKEA